MPKACARLQWLAMALLLLLPAPSAVCKLASLRCTEHMGEGARRALARQTLALQAMGVGVAQGACRANGVRAYLQCARAHRRC